MAIPLPTFRIPVTGLIDSYNPTTKILPDADKMLDDPILGDEFFGQEQDEAPIPEDPTDIDTIEFPRLVYANRNPRTPCPICRPYIGTVWQHGCQPRLPRHEHCYCYYQETYVYETKNKNRFRHDPQNQAAMEDKLM